jgi:hypothetical protein
MTIAVDFANGTTVSGDGDYESGTAMRAFNGAAQRAAINLLHKSSWLHSDPQRTPVPLRPPMRPHGLTHHRLSSAFASWIDCATRAWVSPEEYRAKRRTILEAL